MQRTRGDLVGNMLFEPIRLTAVLRGILCGVLVCVGMRELATRNAVAQDDGPLRSSDRETISRWRPLRGNSLKRVLDRESNFNLAGHATSFGSLEAYLSLRGYVGISLSIPIEIDQFALFKQGIDLDELAPYSELHAGGVSRRSSIRFIFDAGGVGYYIDGQRLVITTKQVARTRWLLQLKKPEMESLASPDVEKRREIVFAAGFWPLDPDVWVEPLAKALNDDDRQVSFDAAYALGELGPPASDAIDALIQLLQSNDPRRREAAAFALGKIGPKAADRLLKLIDGMDESIAIAAAKAMNVMGSAGNSALSGLIEIAKRRSDGFDRRESLCVAVAAVGMGDAIPKLQALLKSGQAHRRTFAARTLGYLRSRAKSCGEDLLPLLIDQETDVRIAAAYALANIDLDSDFPTDALEAAAKDSDRHVSLRAQSALRQIKPKK